MVGLALDLPGFHIDDWRCSPLSGHISNPATGGIFRVSGTGGNNERRSDWSLILKIVHLTEEAPPNWGTDLLHFGYWKREALAYRSGMLVDLTNDLQAPQCLAVVERLDGSVWIWLEEVAENSALPWSVARFGLAARHFGEWQGSYLAGRQLPEAPWLKPGWLQSWINHFQFLADYIGRREFWDHPLVQYAFPNPVEERVLQLWSERDLWLSILDRMPHTVCHFDLWRPNMLACRDSDGHERTVALDWQCVGLGPAGEVGNLLVTSLMNLEVDAEDATELDCALWTGYLAGMRKAGWAGDPREVRFCYAAYPVLRWALVFPMLMILPCVLVPDRRAEAETKYGKSIQQLLKEWAGALYFLLDLADEARRLAAELAEIPGGENEVMVRT